MHSRTRGRFAKEVMMADRQTHKTQDGGKLIAHRTETQRVITVERLGVSIDVLLSDDQAKALAEFLTGKFMPEGCKTCKGTGSVAGMFVPWPVDCPDCRP